jgi:hypothetical protein
MKVLEVSHEFWDFSLVSKAAASKCLSRVLHLLSGFKHVPE